MAKIKLFCLGHVHAAHGPLEYLLEIFKENKHKFSVAEEYYQDVDLETKLKICHKQARTGYDLNNLREIIEESKKNKDENGGKIPTEKLMQFLKGKKSDFVNVGNIEKIVQGLQNGAIDDPRDKWYSSRVEYDLLKYLKTNKVSYATIDMDESEGTRMLNEMSKAGQEMFYQEIGPKWEMLRITAMVTNIRKAIDKHLSTGGNLYVINLGLIHVHRLAAYLFRSLKDNPMNNLEIEIVPVRMFCPDTFYIGTGKNKKFISDYKTVSMDQKDFPKALAYSIEYDKKREKNPDMIKLLEQYEKDCMNVYFTQNKETSKFECPELDRILGRVVARQEIEKTVSSEIKETKKEEVKIEILHLSKIEELKTVPPPNKDEKAAVVSNYRQI